MLISSFCAGVAFVQIGLLRAVALEEGDDDRRGEEEQDAGHDRDLAPPDEAEHARSRARRLGQDRLVLQVALEVLGELERGCIPALGILLDRLHADELERLRDPRIELPRSRRFGRRDQVHDHVGGRMLERPPAREDLVQRDPERIDVGAARDGDALRRHLLGTHVRERSEDFARRRDGVARGLPAREAEVDELHPAPRVDQDVRGLHVAVQDSHLVRGVQRSRGVDEDPEIPLHVGVGNGRLSARRGVHRLRRERGPEHHRLIAVRHQLGRVVRVDAVGTLPVRQHALERGTVDVLHRDEVVSVGLAERVDLDDVRMSEPGRGGRLATEALDRLRVAPADAEEHLQRHAAIERDLVGFVDDAHPAASDLADDLEISDLVHRPYHKLI